MEIGTLSFPHLKSTLAGGVHHRFFQTFIFLAAFFFTCLSFKVMLICSPVWLSWISYDTSIFVHLCALLVTSLLAITFIRILPLSNAETHSHSKLYDFNDSKWILETLPCSIIDIVSIETGKGKKEVPDTLYVHLQ